MNNYFYTVCFLVFSVYADKQPCVNGLNIYTNWWRHFFNNVDEANWFHKWAFSYDIAAELTNMDRVQQWNKIHGHIYLIKPYYSIPRTLPVMVTLWQNEIEKRMKVYYKHERRNNDQAQ